MNVVSHAVVGYVVCGAVLGPKIAADNAVPIIVAATAIDIDHLPQLLARLPGMWRSKQWNLEARSMAHELVGLMVVTILCLALGIWWPILSTACFIAALTHYACDYVTGRSHPFWPISPFVLNSGLFEPQSHRWATEGLITFIAGAGLWCLLA